MILHTKILVRISMASVTLFYVFPKQLLIDQDLNFGRNLWSTTHTFIALGIIIHIPTSQLKESLSIIKY